MKESSRLALPHTQQHSLESSARRTPQQQIDHRGVENPLAKQPLQPTNIEALQRIVGNQVLQRQINGFQLQRFLDPGTAYTNMLTAKQYIQNHYQQLRARYEANSEYKDLLPELNTAIKAYRGNKSPQVVSEVIRVLNAIEEELKSLEIKDVDDILVGTEFTFTKPALHGLRLNETYKDDKEGKKAKQTQENLARIAEDHIYAWAEEVKRQVPQHLTLNISTVNAKDGSKRARRFDYTQTTGGAVWYWILDMDDGCLETQTQPSSFTTLASKDVKFIIEEHIFGVAPKLDLHPHTDIGGGHISLDSDSMLGESSTRILDLLIQLQSKAKEWQEFFQDTDAVNAPWVNEQEGEIKSTYIEELQHLRAQAATGKINRNDVLKTLTDLNSQLINPEVGRLEETQQLHSIRMPDHWMAKKAEIATSPVAQERLYLCRLEDESMSLPERDWFKNGYVSMGYPCH